MTSNTDSELQEEIIVKIPDYRPIAWTTENVHVQIEETWSDDLRAGLRGFALVRNGIPQDVTVICDGVQPSDVEWHDRPDVYQHFTDYPRHVKCGFRAWYVRRARHPLSIRFSSGNVSEQTDLTMDAAGLIPCGPFDWETGLALESFAERVNRECRNVLEIGSRVVSPGSESKRKFFAPHVTYTGFDYYGDDNTDVVGDAHQLSRYFPQDQRFDALFSVSVLEHLAMPWLAAMEMNKVLSVGGLAFHSTVFTWPLHEMPWDFWRFTHEGLKVLFSREMGFEVLAAGLSGRARVHPEAAEGNHGHNPLHQTWMESHILARKIDDFSTDRFRWETTTEKTLAGGSHYPVREK